MTKPTLKADPFFGGRSAELDATAHRVVTDAVTRVRLKLSAKQLLSSDFVAEVADKRSEIGVADFRDDREPLFCRLVLGLGAGTMRAMQVRPHLTLTLHT